MRWLPADAVSVSSSAGDGVAGGDAFGSSDGGDGGGLVLHNERDMLLPEGGGLRPPVKSRAARIRLAKIREAERAERAAQQRQQQQQQQQRDAAAASDASDMRWSWLQDSEF
jgi:hypothetical protein